MLTTAVALIATSACFAAGPATMAGPSAASAMKEVGTITFGTDPATHAESADKLIALVKQAATAQTGMTELTDAQVAQFSKMFLLRAWQAAPAPAATSQIDAIVADGKPAALVPTAKLYKTLMVVRDVQAGTVKFEDATKIVEAYAAENPTEALAPSLLSALASGAPNEAAAKAIQEKILTDFPKSQAAAGVMAERKQAEMVGKPFELTFKDFTTGKEISVQKDLKGKVVIVDFWATWCGPCVASLPELTEQYKKFKAQGVEIVGVSLDQPPASGGDAKLKAFLASHPDMTWPQYYQGNFWDSEFSKGLGINAIPAMFVIDADGKVASINGRGNIDKLVPELIAKRDASKT